MREITIDQFEKERWHTGFVQTSKSWTWHKVSDLTYLRNWLENNTTNRYMVTWDTGNKIGRVWFEEKSDLERFENRFNY